MIIADVVLLRAEIIGEIASWESPEADIYRTVGAESLNIEQDGVWLKLPSKITLISTA